MRPLILIYFSIGFVYGRPQFLNSPTPTPSAAPATLANFRNPTISPYLLIENVPYSGQFGIPPVFRIDGKPQGLLLAQPQYGFPFGGTGYNFAQPGFNFAQPRFNFVQPGFNFAQPSFNFAQPGLNFGQHFFNIGSPQQTFGTRLIPAQLNEAPTLPTPNLGLSAAPTRPTPDISIEHDQVTVSPAQVDVIPTQVDVSPPQVDVSPAQVDVSPVQATGSPAQFNLPSTPSSSRIALAEERNVESSSGGSIIYKHFYLHVPPPEPEFDRSPRVIVPPPRKNLRIIFIKAPPPPKPVITLPPPDDDKTIVYVLASKPEPLTEIKIQTTTPTSPPKPEVYFIRYDAQKQPVPNSETPTSTESTEPEYDDETEKPLINIDTRFKSDDTDVGQGVKAVTLNLNEASLTGGSALSQAVTGIPDDNAVLVSTTPAPNYDSDHK